MDLFRLMIVLRQPQANIVLNFNSRENAEAAFGLAKDAKFNGEYAMHITDDYGNVTAIFSDQIAAILFTELSKDFNAQREVELMRRRAMTKLEKESNSDTLIAKPAQVMGGNGAMPQFMPPFGRG